jgi:hypothetical protein
MATVALLSNNWSSLQLGASSRYYGAEGGVEDRPTELLHFGLSNVQG